MNEEKFDLSDMEKYTAKYEEIYNDYYAVVRRIVSRLLNDRSYVEDVIQDVFLKIFISLPTYNAKLGSLGAWIVKVSTSQVYEHYRNLGHIQITPIDDVSLLVDTSTTGEDEAISDKVIYCTSDLDELSRRIFILKLVYGYSHKEVAEVMGVTEDISKKRYRKAHKEVQIKWREYEEK